MSQTVTSSVTALPTASSGPTASAGNGNTSGTGSGTILLPHPSPSLSAQAEGQLIRAVVVGPTADGKTIVDTRFGKFALPLATTPSSGSVLQLQIVKSGTPVELLLLGSENRAPATQTSALIRVPQPPPALLTLTNGELFRGLVVNGAADGKTIIDTRFGQLTLQLSNPPANGSTLQLQIVKSGTPLDLRLVSTEAPNAGQAPAAKSASSGALTVGETVVGRYAPSANSAAAASPGGLTAGGFHARVVAIHATPPAATAATANEAVVTGRIVASQTGGPTVIETAAGRIALPTTGGALTGRFVTLQIVAEPGTVLPTNPSTAYQRSLMSLSHNWTALADVIDAATTSNPQVAAQFSATAIPNTGVTLTSGIALFLAILTRGQLPEWLGPDVVRLMESTNRQPLLNQLSDDFNQIVRLAGEPTNSDWRVAMLPLLHDGSLQQIRLYLRERYGGEEDDKKLGTRFVIEASLSHLGDIQLDGLVRAARFDLMVRTQAPLPRAMRSEIAELFAQANEEFGVQGRINFQVQERFPVDPVDELSEHAVGVYA
ncbi:MAG: hypothetical protein GKS02_03545 [Alphaproteobacteria bacterium]|nr:hypothetical protein [Alphaproteobacteria bacterium]